MATRTRTVEARKYDHLYDPDFAVSGAVDFAKATQAAQFAGLERVPATNNMFSDLGHHPRHEYRFANKADLPDHVETGFRGPPAGPPPENMEQMVTGPHRFKYFRKPVVPYLHAVPPEVMLDNEDTGAAETTADAAAAAATLAQLRRAAEEDGVVIMDGKRTIGSQTIYRDGEAQTDPYTPDYVLKAGEPKPEVLELAHMKAGTHLPPSKLEIEHIDRMRQRKSFEASLPPMTDEAAFTVRRRMMEDQELLQWGYREQQVDDTNERRLAKLKEALDKRDQEAEFIQEQRVEDLRRRRADETEASLASIQKRRIKALRKLGNQRKDSEHRVDMLLGTGAAVALGTRGARRDIIGDYATFKSKVYAPVTRDGRYTDKPRPDLEATVAAVADLDGADLATLNRLDATLPPRLTETRVRKPRLPAESTTKRRDRERAADLARVDTMIRTAKLGQSKADAVADALPAWRKHKERVVRPPTPTFDSDDDGSDADDAADAVVLLQKLVRGRAIQNLMFEGKERRIELIRELQEEGDAEAQAEAEAQAQAEAAAATHMAACQDATLDTLQGEVMSATLDFLSKELVRMTEHGRIAAKVAAAERTRRVREAEESGRRQAEDHMRLKQDVVYKQLQRVHAQTADTFVDAALEAAMERASAEEALRETRLRSSVLVPLIDRLEDQHNDGAVVVKDLVASFLVPEVERRRVQEQIELNEKKYVDAARKTIEETVKSVEKSDT